MRKLIPLLTILLCGCAVVTQKATTTTTDTNGVVTVTSATSRILAVGDAKSTVDRVRASAGKTSSVGLSGVDNNATATNVVQQAAEFLGTLAKSAR